MEGRERQAARGLALGQRISALGASDPELEGDAAGVGERHDADVDPPGAAELAVDKLVAAKAAGLDAHDEA